MSIWAESHAAILTWDEDNDYAFDASQINDNWEVLVKGRPIGELETVNFDELG